MRESPGHWIISKCSNEPRKPVSEAERTEGAMVGGREGGRRGHSLNLVRLITAERIFNIASLRALVHAV